MPSSCVLPAARGRAAVRRVGLAAGPVAAAAAVLAAAGCGGQPAAAIPAASPPVAAPAGSAQPVSGTAGTGGTGAPGTGDSGAQQATASAYKAFFPVLRDAESAAPAKAAAMLGTVAAQPYLRTVLAQMAGYRSRHLAASGYVVPHIMTVSVTGSSAVVHDCQDASHATLTSTRTGKAAGSSAGSARTYLIAGLSYGGGRWRLTSLAHVAVTCRPGQ